MNWFKQKQTLSFDLVQNFNGKLFESNQWNISEFVIESLIPVVDTKPFPLAELELMVSAVVWSSPELIFDWGTHIGKSARVFTEVLRAIKSLAKIYSIDLPDNVNHVEHPGSERGRLVRDCKEVVLIQGDGVSEALKIYEEKSRPRKALFFLDGDHEYRSVKRELDLISKRVKSPNILVHDTFFQTRKSGYNIGPFRAVQWAIKNYNYRAVSVEMGLPGMTLLYK